MRLLPTSSATFSGGTDHRAFALAIGLGLLAGFVTGPSLTLLAVLLVVLLLNAHTRTFIFAWGTAWTLNWPLRPLTAGLGRLLLTDTWCAEVLRGWDDSLLPVMLDWHRYTTFGGLLVGGLIAMVATWRILHALSSLPPASATTPNSPAHRRASLEVRCWARLQQFLVQETPSTARWTRPWGIPAAIACSCLVALLVSWTSPHLCRRALITQLTQWNGAEVTAGEIAIELSTGHVTINDLRLADPTALDHDRWRIGRVEGTLNLGLLARGRLDISTLSLTSLRDHVRRAEPARPYGDRALRSLVQAYDEPVLLTPSVVELQSGARESEILLSGLARDWPTVAERLRLVHRIVSGVEDLHDLEITSSGDSHEFAPARGHARLAIEKLTMDGFSRAWGFGPKSHLTLKHVSSAPTYNSRSVELTLVTPELAGELRATLNLLDDAPRHELSLDLYDLPLARILHPEVAGGRLAIAGGVADLRASGTCDRDGLDLDVRLDVRSVDARFTGEEPLAGVSTIAWNETLRRLNPLRGRFAISGRWTSPRIKLDEAQLVADLKLQLRAANEQTLVEVIDRQRAQYISERTTRSTGAELHTPPAEPNHSAPFVSSAPPEATAESVACTPGAITQRSANYDRYQSNDPVVASSTPSTGTSAPEDSLADAAPAHADEGNPLFEKMIPAAPTLETVSDDVCKSCMTESYGANYLPPGTEIHAPQVSIDRPAHLAGDAVVSAPNRDAATEYDAPSTTSVATTEQPTPELAYEVATPANIIPATRSTTPPIYTPNYAATSQQTTGADNVSQTVPASATAAAEASNTSHPSSTTGEPATFLGIQTGYADGVAETLPLENSTASLEVDELAAEEPSSGSIPSRAQTAGERVASWTGGVVSRVKGWWPRRVTDEERAMLAGSGVQVDPWADEAAIQGEAVAATPESIETPTTPAATLIAAEPAPADSTTDEIPTADVEREIEYEARQPVSTWERLQFWRTRR